MAERPDLDAIEAHWFEICEASYLDRPTLLTRYSTDTPTLIAYARQLEREQAADTNPAPQPWAEHKKAPDLMAALEDSLAAARRDRRESIGTADTAAPGERSEA